MRVAHALDSMLTPFVPLTQWWVMPPPERPSGRVSRKDWGDEASDNSVKSKIVSFSYSCRDRGSP